MNNQRPRKLLVVDDDPECQRLLHALLVGQGYQVISATDGQEGFERILRDRPDIVLTDWVMPKMDGLELVRKVRAELSWYPYILLVTCRSEQQLGLDMGADDFVSKPIRGEHLLPRIRAGERIVTLQERLREKNLELKLANQQLAELAVTDPLSGLLNRRAFFEESKREWHRAARYDLPLSCLMIDIDRFKRINDTYGHSTGDSAIRTVGNTLRGRLRDTDIICRYGGEEFCVLLTNTPIDAADALAERLRVLISELAIPQLPVESRLTISIGVASRSLHTLSEQTLVDQADVALLAAKRSGRNRVARHDELDDGVFGTVAERSALTGDPVLSRDPIGLAPSQIVNTLLGALAHRDADCVAHCQRVARSCEELGQYLGLDPVERNVVEMAALLHEIGRLALPDSALRGAADQQDPSGVVPRCHDLTVELVHECFANASLAEIVRFSRQNYDGSQGAPQGDQIPLGARILAIAELFDNAIHGHEGYDQHTKGEAIRRLRQAAGQRFDSHLVEQFATMLQSRAPAPIGPWIS